MTFDLVSFALGFAASIAASGLVLGVLVVMSRPRKPRASVQSLPPATILTPGRTTRKRRA